MFYYGSTKQWLTFSSSQITFTVMPSITSSFARSCCTAALLSFSAAQSQAVVVMISASAGNTGVVAAFINANFSNVTEVRQGDYSNIGLAASQDALNGTGAFAGSGPAEVFIMGRTLASASYVGANAKGINALAIPVISLTSYVSRSTGGRLGWHTSAVDTAQLNAGAETTVTAAGSPIVGFAAGAADFHLAPAALNAIAAGSVGFGGGQIVGSVGTGSSIVYWPSGAAPGDPTTAGPAGSPLNAFPAARLLFNLDDTGGGPAAYAGNLTNDGRTALANAIDFVSPLTAVVVVPEPTSTLSLGLAALALLGRRRRS